MKTGATTAVLATAALALATAGCVERKMMIRSDPPAAEIALDGELTGLATPAAVPFDFGGVRRVTLIAPGHRVLDAEADVADPWFTYFPLDIAAEFLWPFTIRDEQTFTYKLDPYATDMTAEEKADAKRRLSELKLRAAEYRAGGSEGPGGTKPPAPPPPADAPKK